MVSAPERGHSFLIICSTPEHPLTISAICCGPSSRPPDALPLRLAEFASFRDIATGETRCFRGPWIFCIPLGPKLVTDLSAGAFFASTKLVAMADAKRLVELAAKQKGVVNRADLISAGVSWKWLRGRLATGEWNRVHRGVFRLGCHQPTREEREMAASARGGRRSGAVPYQRGEEARPRRATRRIGADNRSRVSETEGPGSKSLEVSKFELP